MDKLMMIILTVGPAILCWKIIKLAFSSFISGGKGGRMLFGKLPLLDESSEPSTKAMSSLVGPISNPDVKDVVLSKEKAPKLNMPWNETSRVTQPQSAAKGNVGLGAVVGLVNVVGTMPQMGNIKNKSLRTITGFMPQSGMIYNRAKKFGAVQQNAGQIFNQMRGGRVTMQQLGQAQGNYIGKNVRVIGTRGQSVYSAQRIRTIRGANGESLYRIGKGVKSIKGITGTSIYRLGERGIRKIKGVRGNSTYHVGTRISRIRDINGMSNFRINGEVRKLKAPNGVIYSAKFSRRLRGRDYSETLTAPIGTLAQATDIGAKNNIGLAVNDFYMPRIQRHFNVNTVKLSESLRGRAYRDPNNNGLTRRQLNKFVEIDRVSRDDDRFKELGNRDRKNVQDLFRYAAKNYTDLSSREILDLTATAKELDDTQSRRERADVARRINERNDSRRKITDELNEMLKKSTMSNNLSQYIDDNLQDIGINPKDKEQRAQVEESLKKDILDEIESNNSNLTRRVLGNEAADRLEKIYKEAEMERKDAISATLGKEEMRKDIRAKEQHPEIYGQLTLSQIRDERQNRARQRYFDQAVEQYPGYAETSIAQGNFGRQPYINYEPRT